MFKGALIAQIIGFLGTLVLAKLYGESAYGIFGVFISFSGFFSILNTFQLEQCLVITNHKGERKNLFNSLFLITLISSLIVAFFVFVISFFFQNQTDKFFIILLSILFSIASSFNKIHEYYLTFKENFKKISEIKVLTIAFNLALQLILFQQFKLKGLVYGNLISIILISIYYFTINKPSFSSINSSLLKKTLINNKTIVVHVLPATLISSVAINILPILITLYFGLEVYGVYFLSWKILSTPFFLINSSVAQVYYKKANNLLTKNSSELFETTKKIVYSNIGLMLFFLILINTIGIYFLELFLNKSWENLKTYTLILSFLILAKSAFIPISDIIIVLKKNHMHLIFNCYLFIINFFGFYIGHLYNSINISLILITFFGCIGYLSLLFYSLKEIKKVACK
ncbi:Membrane protein involved in the export of O-antigen and teichoic acid [Lutibacter oricola]|uniref:Membrane protein involved in the export of O-antigen and teichoic acid n=2 Tax=Lutibacter oricola TaxID=762486 RepID=A0A1H2YZP2_9FLAO|nr:Membrane protein involved in the export of O-antigen and teichoic acid [Lutibacter oricola]